jgi:hypothetical protein
MVPTVERLNYSFDASKMVEEYLNLMPDHQLPKAYLRTPIFNGDDFLPTVREKCPYIVTVCDTIRTVFKFNHVLFRSMAPYSNLSWHRDADCDILTYHVPVTTNKGCFFISEPWAVPMQEAGQLYRVDSTSFHTFINAGSTPRVHLHCVHDNLGEYLSGEYMNWTPPYGQPPDIEDYVTGEGDNKEFLG